MQSSRRIYIKGQAGPFQNDTTVAANVAPIFSKAVTTKTKDWYVISAERHSIGPDILIIGTNHRIAFIKSGA